MWLLHISFRSRPFTYILLLNHWCRTCVCWTSKLTASSAVKHQKQASCEQTGPLRTTNAAATAIAALLTFCTFSFPTASFGGDNIVDYTTTTTTTTTRPLQSSISIAATSSTETFQPFPGLKAPSEEFPQITFDTGNDIDNNREESSTTATNRRTTRRAVLPQGARSSNGKDPILQGLVYFLDDNPTVRKKPSPSPSDMLVIVARRSPSSIEEGGSSNSEVVAGAKIQISKLRFPVLLVLYEENLLISPSEWETVSSKEDVYIDALICPTSDSEDSKMLLPSPSSSKIRDIMPCTEEQSTFKAHGLAKLISNLPGLPPGEAVRAAATLQLQ